LPRRFFRTN